MKQLILVSLILSFTGCLHKGNKLLTEKGKVVGKQYTPDTRSVELGTGVSSKGTIVTTVHNTGQSERFNVVFQCEHGNIFTIEDKDIYAKVSDGDSVNINYYELLNRKGIVKDYKFIDANKR